ncbi:alpha-glucan family phosphorylase [Baaleninema simplex]|uniref:alpha-glucan family phosphorylase n=1 Tax=Baaleninema simplex TaxID=2862350 RepID=UPI00036FC896|nr:alpha-glucan family phosphorylase [Baaleninema simplex]
MQPIYKFNVSPSLPDTLEPLRKLAYNLHWDWNTDTKDLFQRLDRDLWESSRHNPVLMLGTISQQRLQEVAEDEGFIAHMNRAALQLDDYLTNRPWYRQQRGKEREKQGSDSEYYAYFSAEFGLCRALPIYSGGLGVLAGDHLKSASDLGLPLVGVGLLYQEGYFAQYLNADGWQQERYPINDFYNLPLHPIRNPDGSELRISVDYPGRTVYARAWRVQVGTVSLYMLDTNIEPNSQYDQDITDQLYGGDKDLRIHQEIMLGIGGVKLLKALGLNVTAYHMNEGHSAFMALERMRMLMQEEGLSFEAAEQVVVSSSMFTTHTPVPAGFDLFPAEMVMHYLGHYAEIFGLSREEFLALGRENTGDFSAPFNMAIFAIRMSGFINSVAKLHGKVSRAMFQHLWNALPTEEVPVTSITNGVHARSCVAKETQELYDRYLGPEWSTSGANKERLWRRVLSIPDEELWRNHERRRAELVVFARDWLVKCLEERGASLKEIEQAKDVLDPGVLTIGFARRFATYKRATLFLRDLDRLKRMMNHADRRVQFVIAGKAHPKDMPGKELIRDIVHTARDEGMHDWLVFLPNYDIEMSRLMVAGCDVWLNTPRRPREASGTSGMKAAMNGLPNLSVLDGWWDEADYARTGWAIGHGEMYDDPNYQDEVEANDLYDLLEKEVIPLFYDRDADEIPHGWVTKMKDAVRLNCPTFNTARMVKDYARRAYFVLSDRYVAMTEDRCQPAKELAQWKHRVERDWYEMKIDSVEISDSTDVQVNQPIFVKAWLDLAALQPEDVTVELYRGEVDDRGNIINGTPVAMEYCGKEGDRSLYRAEIAYNVSGLQGLSLRVLPDHPGLSNPHEMGLILWAQ